MSLGLMSIVLVAAFVVLLSSGLEIFAAIGLTASIGLLLFANQPLSGFATTSWSTLNSFSLTCMPLFVFMGAIYHNTGAVAPLFQGANKWMGGVPGGMACSVLIANAIFGAMSGSSVAAAATFGKIAFPQMEKLGYSPKFALGTIAMGGTLSVLIPPSVILVLYGIWHEISIARLFAAGLIHGLILAFLLLLTIVVQAIVNPGLAPKLPKTTWLERVKALVGMLPFLSVIIIVLGIIFAGIMTPTEAAALGAFLSIVVAAAYRKMTFAALKNSALTAVEVTAMIGVILVSAKMLGQVFQYIGLTGAANEYLSQLSIGKYGMIAIICVMYVILGMFFESFCMMVLTMPFVTPLIVDSGFSLLWFGVLFVVLAEIGLVTPPFGLNLFVIRSVVPQYDLMLVARGALPYLIPAFLMLVVLIAFPEIALWLPRILY